MKKFKSYLIFPVSLEIFLFCLGANATGLQPESTILLLSAASGQAQIGIKNTEDQPMIMNVKIVDLPGSEKLTVLPVPAVARIEANGRQVVRVALDKPAIGLEKQYLKRVSFEGIPPKRTNSQSAIVNVNVRQTIPLVISPADLEQIPEPWKKLVISRGSSGAMEVANDSPFVVRLKADAELLPMKAPVRLLKDTYVLPGEKHVIELPKDVDASTVKSIRIFPASPWGFAVDPYEIPVTSAPVASAATP
ncbi:fimbria/pilus chaperone family protein [Pseudacidovorax intermedius]|nr:fimbria/pilus chaperone family protein [Pseudacidovorax intermedius]